MNAIEQARRLVAGDASICPQKAIAELLEHVDACVLANMPDKARRSTEELVMRDDHPIVLVDLPPRQVLQRALDIADRLVRSEIEGFAVFSVHDGAMVFSLTEVASLSETGMEDLQDVQRAAEYIRLRGDVFPFRMLDIESMPGFVQFIDKEYADVD